MTIFLTIVHIFVCVFLVIVVLLQSGKAADLAGAFGGMGSQTAFGPRGAATVLSKATAIASGLFMVTSLSLAILATRNAGGSSSVLERTGTSQKKATPVQTPATATQQPPQPAAAAPAGTPPGVPVQPTVDLVDSSGKVVRSMPLDLSKLPQVDPNKPNIPVTQPGAAPNPAGKK